MIRNHPALRRSARGVLISASVLPILIAAGAVLVAACTGPSLPPTPESKADANTAKKNAEAKGSQSGKKDDGSGLDDKNSDSSSSSSGRREPAEDDESASTPRPPEQCTTDAACGAATRVCEQGKCIKGCRDASGCASNQVCDGTSCVRAQATGGCAADVECNLGMICVSRSCVSGCRGTPDCPIAEVCIEGSCELDTSGTSSSSSSSSSGGGSGSCAGDAQCNPFPSGMVCSGGRCIPGCRTDAVCPGALLCVDGQCT